MRNPRLDELDGLVGTWRTTLSDAWFLEPRDATITGTTTIGWLGEAFLVVRSRLDASDVPSESTIVIGRSDPDGAYRALYHDARGVCRAFAMSFGEGRWALARADGDMHQRILADVEPDVVRGRAEVSLDLGATWRKDFDFTYERA